MERVWMLVVVLLMAGMARGEMVIQEIHYNPRERGMALEFIELVNASDQAVDLSQWSLSGAVTFPFPDKTIVPAGGLIVVAEDTKVLGQVYGVKALGTWEGKLSNSGEKLTLRDSVGRKQDEVDYGVGFPWPTLAAGGGASMELIHPGLDNDLGGSWRSSIARPKNPSRGPVTFLGPGDTKWRYFKGLMEPRKGWRTLDFDHRDWEQGAAPLGYSDGDDRTVLGDMLGRYTTLYLRHKFVVNEALALDRPLSLKVYSDDGAVVWINGKEAARLRVAEREPSHRAQTIQNHEAAWEEIILDQPSRFLKKGENIVAVLGVNGDPTSSDFSIDLSLAEVAANKVRPRPSPGEINRSAMDEHPPQIRQVKQEPTLAKSGQPVHVSAKVTDTDGVSEVVLQVQRLVAGDYIDREDARYERDWKSIPMDGEGDLYSATIPGGSHRELVRYRIVATDRKGAQVRAPYEDDTQPNFAYYCYDGVPEWTGADRPGRTAPKTFSADLLGGVPNLHLIASESDVLNSQYGYRYNEQFLNGTLVVGDRVYDHIRFRNRGETTTYMVGKNKWRINFNRAHEFSPELLDGKSKNRRWKRLNLNPGTVPYHPAFRGNAALNERLAFRLYQFAGIPAPDTAHILLRVVDAEQESTRDQYTGDLWGLYMAFEAIDGFMLDNHGVPDGELHRISQGGNSIERTPSVPAPPGLSFPEFWSRVRSSQPAEWWAKTIDLDHYYRFHAISIAAARSDQKLNHNHFLYRHPERGWQPLPWDTDMCLQAVIHQPNGLRWHPFLKGCLRHEAYWIAYANRARELLDLLLNKDQVYALVDELVRGLGPIEGTNLPELDQYLWNYHPQTSRRHQGTFFLEDVSAPSQRRGYSLRLDKPGFAGRVQYFKDYLTPMPKIRGKVHWGMGYRQLAEDIQDPDIPARPTLKLVSGLRFQCSGFADPQGQSTFAGMRWRIGEIYNPTVGGFVPGDHHRYEVDTVWESPVLTTYQSEIDLANIALTPGRTYRLRVRFGDNTGRWGHWSAPVQFVAQGLDTSSYEKGLVISEIMYHPRPDDGALEFIELMNIGSRALPLRALQFASGVEFDFKAVRRQALKPKERVVIASDREAFVARYPERAATLIGTWSSGKLDNGGERLSLRLGKGQPFLNVRYDDASPWPEEADGRGASLILKAPLDGPDLNDGASWIASPTN